MFIHVSVIQFSGHSQKNEVSRKYFINDKVDEIVNEKC